MKRKLLSWLLAVVMLVVLLPGMALAAEADWAGAMNFNDDNNQVTTTISSLTAANHTKMNWAYPLNTEESYFDAYYAGSPVIVGDYLYATGGGELHKVDIVTGVGEEIASGVGGETHYFDYLCYADMADGLLILASEHGDNDKLEAFDLSGKLLGSVTGSFGFYLPVQYHDGYVFCNGHIFQLGYDGGKVHFTQVGKGTIGGAAFNWSSGAFVNDLFYVVAETTVYAVDYKTGEVIDSYEFDAERSGYNDTQGGVAYDEATDCLYWGTYEYNTDLHSIQINADDGKFVEDSYKSVNIDGQTVCTPVIADGKVYIGTQDGRICVYDIDTREVVSYHTYGGNIRSGLIVSVVDGETRVYAQAYDGHLYMLADGEVSQIAKTANYTGVKASNAYEPITMDKDGNIYCYNESGYMFSFGVSDCELPTFVENLSTETIKYDIDGSKPVPELTVQMAELESDGELSYQWEMSTDKIAFADIEGAAAASYTPDIAEIGTTYYRCKVTNTVDGKSESVYSEIAEVCVKDLSDNTAINIMVNGNNNAANGAPVAAKLTGGSYTVIREEVPTNIWIGTQDGNSVTGFTVLQGAAVTPGFTAKADGNVWNSVTYDGYYRSTYSYPLTANIEVTAEDDTVETYKLVITKDGKYTPSLYVTIVSDGEVVVPQQELIVTDYNSDGVTVDDALYAAHKANYDGGAEAGYGSENDAQYGLSLAKLWGKEGSFGYWLNNASCWSLGDEVFAGDHVVAFVYEEGYNDYAKFDKFSYSATADLAFELELATAGYDTDWNVVWNPLAEAVITAYDSEMKKLAENAYTVTEVGNGKYSVAFFDEGNYYLVATYEGVPDEEGTNASGAIVPAVCQVTAKSVYVTIADAGKAVLAMHKVDYADYNDNGKFDVDDALYAAHQASYDGGAAAGYATVVGEYGLGLAKLWGDGSGRYGYWLNNATCWSLVDEVTGGDHLVAFVYKDAGYSDAYSYFDSLTYNAKVESELLLNLKAVQWVGSDAVHNPFAGAGITAYDSNMNAIAGTDYKVVNNENGTYSVTFTEAGTYYLQAESANDAVLVPAVCQVIVTEGEGSGNTGTVVPTTMKITFSLITHKDTWIAEHDVTLSLGATVYDAFHKVMDRRSGFSFEADRDYVRSITYKGTKLGEFDMGRNSGWKYMVNGVASGVGMESKVLDDGDELVWYYVEDYTLDTDRDEGNFSTVVVPEEIIVPDEQTFTDVEGHWALEAINYVCANGLMQGVAEGEFAPNDPLSRAMLVTILYRLESEPNIDAENLYQDVVNGAWYTDAILWASANGIVQGHGEGGFAPNDNVTREQIAAILMRYSEYKKYDVTQGGMSFREYPDYEQIAEWARPNIQWATAVGLISGDENGMLNPQGDATRAEAATILMRYLKEYVGWEPEEAE